MEKIYLDVCCLNRPFDDQTQDRIHLESEAIRIILKLIKKGSFIWVGSTVIDLELNRTPDLERRKKVGVILSNLGSKVEVNLVDIKRAEELELLGFKAIDALHVACAEKLHAGIFLTTDDQLLKKGKSNLQKLKTRILNPVIWLQEVIK